MKKNIYFIAGQFFIWAIPIICLIVMAFTGKTDGIKIKTWVSVALILMVAIYFIKGKKELAKVKERQLTKDNYVHLWVRVIEYVVAILPFVVALLLLESIKTDIDEATLFVVICMISITIGYLCLCADSKEKEPKKSK